MENTSDSFMPGSLLFCMKSKKSVCYSVADNITKCKTPLMIYMPKVRMEIFSLILWILSYREKIYYWHIEISKQMQAVKQQEQTVQ